MKAVVPCGELLGWGAAEVGGCGWCLLLVLVLPAAKDELVVGRFWGRPRLRERRNSHWAPLFHSMHRWHGWSLMTKIRPKHCGGGWTGRDKSQVN